MKKLALRNLFWIVLFLISVSKSISQIPVINEFNPTSALVGELIQITGTDLSFVTGASIGTTQAFIVQQEDNSLVLMVNEGSTTGLINLQYAGGTVSSTGNLTIEPFNFYDAPSKVFYKTGGAKSAGSSISLSADGATTAIGEPQTGTVRIYSRVGEGYEQNAIFTEGGQAG